MVKTKLPNLTEDACVFQVPNTQSLRSPVSKAKEAEVKACRCTRLGDAAAKLEGCFEDYGEGLEIPRGQVVGGWGVTHQRLFRKQTTSDLPTLRSCLAEVFGCLSQKAGGY